VYNFINRVDSKPYWSTKTAWEGVLKERSIFLPLPLLHYSSFSLTLIPLDTFFSSQASSEFVYKMVLAWSKCLARQNTPALQSSGLVDHRVSIAWLRVVTLPFSFSFNPLALFKWNNCNCLFGCKIK